jgi:FMN phosphatase YigB (HAD superfamily)
MWQEDLYLSKLSTKIGNIELLSIDIFDTLLFRTVPTPEKIFDILGERLSEAYPEFRIPPECFTMMRKYADTSARKKAWEVYEIEEVTLDDIYREFKLAKEFVSLAKGCEIDLEAESTYINTNVESFIRYCKCIGKKIALVSDIYLSKIQIENLLLKSGFELSLVDYMIISSEFGVLKRSGHLFDKLVKLSGIDAKNILHIGDNPRRDVDEAIITGLQASLYGAVSYSPLSVPSIEMKRWSTVGELRSLREIAAASIKSTYLSKANKSHIELFEIGAMVFGPIYSIFAEWILNQAEIEGAKIILAFMREGELLSQVIRKAAEYRHIDIRIVPVYISRRATEMIGHGTIDSNILNEYIKRDHLYLKDLFSMFYLNIVKTPFCEYADLTLKECHVTGIFENVKSYMSSKSTLSRINEQIDEQKELLIKYISSLTEEQNAVTVDVGFRGTMQACLSKIKANGRGQLTHLMMMGIPYSSKFLLDGTPLRAWLGFGDKDSQAIQDIYRRIQVLEAVTNADIGTTLAYRADDVGVSPVLEDVRIDPDNTINKHAAWDGIFKFQELWFYLLDKKPHLLDIVVSNKIGFLGILSRLLLMPNPSEAKALADLYYDESILNSFKSKVCTGNERKLFSKFENPKDFLYACNNGNTQEHIYWPEGIVAIERPDYLRDEYLYEFGGLTFCRAIKIFRDPSLTDKCVAIYGAGDIGRNLTKAVIDMGIPIYALVDKDEKLQKSSILGINVISPIESMKYVDAYIVTPISHADEISEELKNIANDLNKNPRIIYYNSIRT